MKRLFTCATCGKERRAATQAMSNFNRFCSDACAESYAKTKQEKDPPRDGYEYYVVKATMGFRSEWIVAELTPQEAAQYGLPAREASS